MPGAIALYSPDMCGGGAERVTLNLAREFSNRNVPVDLVLANAKGQYLKEVPSDVRIIDLASNGVFRSMPGLVKYFREEKPLAMLSTQMHANVIALIARRIAHSTARLVVREANIIVLPAEWSVRVRVYLLLLLARICYNWADDIVAVSHGVAHALQNVLRLPGENIRVIYNPVVRPELHEKAGEQVRHPWFNQTEMPIILSVGRLEEQKDFSTLIRAFAIVRQQVPSRLVIFGEGSLRKKLEDLIQTLGLEADVSLPGFTANPYAYMARASVYVLSSAWEGLPNTLIEAMAIGAPVVATDCESGPREILDGGRYGYLAHVGDAEMLAGGILAALTRNDYPRVDGAAMTPFYVERSVDEYLQTLHGERH